MRWRALIGVVLLAVLFHAPTSVARDDEESAAPPVNPRWLDRLPRLDRQLVDELIGKPAPDFDPQLDWQKDGKPRTMSLLRGRVVVIQTFSYKTSQGRRAVKRWHDVLAGPDPIDVAPFFLQTPDGAKGLGDFLARQELTVPFVADPVGRMCDALGAFKKPVNYLIDRTGVIRYAGLNEEGFEAALAELIAEPRPPVRDPEEDETAPETSSEDDLTAFPVQEEITRGARDLRGQRAPKFNVDGWAWDKPTPGNRVIALVFWEPEIKACQDVVPSLNQCVREFGRNVCVVAVAADAPDAFLGGMNTTGLVKDDFKFAVGLEEAGTMVAAAGVAENRHPYMLLISSSDWTVRWQGHPNDIARGFLTRVIQANQDRLNRAAAPTSQPRDRRKRWTG